jgi:4-hydroxybenzoate polyprenyltransferase
MLKSLIVICRMVKIEHSVFALPFAFAGAFLAARGWPGLWPLLVLTVAMVAVRSFAMGFNRLVDLDIDRDNPRTQDRPLVTGELSRGFTMVFLAAMAAIFVGACALMNPLCLLLSPVALVWSAFYSVCKRFTKWCHFVLGSVLGLAPVAGWLSIEPVLTLPAVLLFFGVTFWVAGFDLLYACQDRRFDRERGLHSIPARLGMKAALGISTLSHLVTGIFFILAGWAANLGPVYMVASLVIAAILLVEHRLISEDDMSRVNLAFFTLNGIISVLLFFAVALDLALYA